MINTAPVYGDISQLGTTALFVRFRDAKLRDMDHRASDCLGAHLILVNFLPPEGVYTLTYVNQDNAVLRRISYARESILEITLQESICRIVPAPKAPAQLKALPT